MRAPIEVRLALDPQNPILLGRLAEADRRIYFQWACEAMDVPISPLRLRAQEGLIEAPRDEPRLHDVFVDCLPDAWGRLLVDRALRRRGRAPERWYFGTRSELRHGGGVEAAFRAMVFNIVMHNRDDHSKNFGFLMDENYIWRFSPSYDLTFNHGPSGEHSLDVAGEGSAPDRDDVMRVAKVACIKECRAIEVIEEVNEASLWIEGKLKAYEVGTEVRANVLNHVKVV